MGEEIKKEVAAVRSFRVTDDVMSRFKGLQDEMNLTQDQALKMLVDAYELEAAKNAIPDRETEIANFQAKASELVEAFLFSLQLNQDAENRIRAEFAMQLQSKDQVIAKYQGDLLQAEQTKEGYLDRIRKMQEQIDGYQNLEEELDKLKEAAQEEIQQLKQQVADKESIVAMTKKSLHEAEEKAKEYEVLKPKADALKIDLQETKTAMKDLQKDFEIQTERNARKAEKEKEAAVAEVKEQLSILQSQLTTVQADAKIQILAAANEHAAEIRRLENEKAELKEQLLIIENKLREIPKNEE